MCVSGGMRSACFHMSRRRACRAISLSGECSFTLHFYARQHIQERKQPFGTGSGSRAGPTVACIEIPTQYPPLPSTYSGVGKEAGASPPMKKLGRIVLSPPPPPNIKVMGQLILGTFSCWCFMDSVNTLILKDLPPPPKKKQQLRIASYASGILYQTTADRLRSIRAILYFKIVGVISGFSNV